MSKLVLLELADYALISNENKLSIIGIFDHLFVHKLPTRHSKMFAVGVLEGEGGESSQVEITMKSPSGKDIMPAQKLSVTLGMNGRANILAELANLPIEFAGEHILSISVGGEVVGQKTFSIILAKKPAKRALKRGLPN